MPVEIVLFKRQRFKFEKEEVRKPHVGPSLVAQWLRIHLPMQGAWVRALVREDQIGRASCRERV